MQIQTRAYGSRVSWAPLSCHVHPSYTGQALHMVHSSFLIHLSNLLPMQWPTPALGKDAVPHYQFYGSRSSFRMPCLPLCSSCHYPPCPRCFLRCLPTTGAPRSLVLWNPGRQQGWGGGTHPTLAGKIINRAVRDGRGDGDLPQLLLLHWISLGQHFLGIAVLPDVDWASDRRWIKPIKFLFLAIKIIMKSRQRWGIGCPKLSQVALSWM